MSSEQDEVLSLDDSSGSFYGFSPMKEKRNEEELPEKKKSKPKGNVKSVVVKPSASKGKSKSVDKSASGKSKSKTLPSETPSRSKSKASETTEHDNRENLAIDINKLSDVDIQNLREALGILPVEENETLGPLRDLPNLRVELDANDLSDGEIVEPYNRDVGFDMSQALFEEHVEDSSAEDVWNLPKLKAPMKGNPVSQSLADMINVACTSQCDVEGMNSKYNVPENCEKACAPMVNNEIWKIMDKRAQTNDRGIAEIQNLVATGITPIIKLADILRAQISSNPEAKTLISDSLVILGQVQYYLSVRRRYMIKPTLKKKYQGLCSLSMPVTTKLFGDDLSKDVKSCDALSLGKDYRYPNYRGRGNARFGRRNFMPQPSYGGYGANRYAPYPARGHSRPNRMAGYRIPRRSAPPSCTAPNDQN